jgi:BTB/POZ domain
MAIVVSFNVGGIQYKVSCSLLEKYPNTLLAQIASDHWQSDPEEEIILDRDGELFKFVIDFLQNDGYLALPIDICRESFFAELVHFGFEDVDASKIGCDCTSAAKLFAKNQAVIRSEIQGWDDDHLAVVTLAKECAIIHLLKSDAKLHFDIHGPKTSVPEQNHVCECSPEKWDALLKLLFDDKRKMFPDTREKCYEHLCQFGLEIVSVRLINYCVIQVRMRETYM